MRGLVKVGSYRTAGGAGERRTVQVFGVLNRIEQFDRVEGQRVTAFRDEILRIRKYSRIEPERSPEELMAHIICEDAVDGHPPGPHSPIPNDRYFLARLMGGGRASHALGYVVLGGEAWQDPPEFRVRELGIAPEATEHVGQAELLALLTGVAVAHTWDEGLLNMDYKTADLVMPVPSCDAIGAAALLRMGFEERDSQEGLALRASLSTVLHHFELLAPQIA